MKLIIVVLVLCGSVAAQQPRPNEAPKILRPADPQEVQLAQSKVLEAKTAYDLAQQKLFTLLMRLMAENGLRPSEWAIRQDDQGLYFEKVEPPPAGDKKP